MQYRKPWLAALITVCCITSSSRECLAGYGDLLYGRTTTPYVAGYAPATSVPLSTGAPTNVVLSNGAYQVQAPVYNNPSVYTGQPVQHLPNQMSYRVPVNSANPFVTAYRPVVAARNPVPLAQRLRAANATSNPFYGTGNIYPNNYQTTLRPSYPVGGSAITTSPPIVTAPATVAPVTTLRPVVSAQAPVTVLSPPAATPIAAPLFVNTPQRQPRLGGLARFFGSLWGTNYRSRYYRAPITYYRPLTSVDPISGTTVTVQRPCNSYVYQLQRTPYSSLYSAPAIVQGGGCSTGATCMTQPYVPNTGIPTTSVPINTQPLVGAPPQSQVIGQVGGIRSSSDQSVVPIPSTIPNGAPNPSPLTGNPNASAEDLETVPQPQLESQRPPIPEENASLGDDSYWKLRDADLEADPTALQQLPRGVFSGIGASESGQALRPIQAPDDLQSPFTNRVNPSPSQGFQPSDDYLQEAGSRPTKLRRTVPVHEATLSRPRTKRSKPVVETVHRDNHWQ